MSTRPGGTALLGAPWWEAAKTPDANPPNKEFVLIFASDHFQHRPGHVVSEKYDKTCVFHKGKRPVRRSLSTSGARSLLDFQPFSTEN